MLQYSVMLLLWILTGAIAGWISAILTGNKGGCATNTVVGMIGSVVGGALVNLVYNGTLKIDVSFTTFDTTSIIVSIIGAVFFIILLKIFTSK